MKSKFSAKKVVIVVVFLLAAFIYYYVELPAFNIHSSGTWWFLFWLIVVIAVFTGMRSIRKMNEKNAGPDVEDSKGRKISKAYTIDFQNWKTVPKIIKVWVILLLVFLLVFLVGYILSSPVVNAKKYQKLLKIETSNFASDITEADYSTIPLLDRASAAILGDRKMGSMVDMVSQFEVADDFTQINYQGIPVRVSPLEYAGFVKWFTNQKEGIPAYIRIDMTSQSTECVKLTHAIKYSKSEYFNRNIYRHLRFRYPTYIFADQIFFEIDEDGNPVWICPVKKFNIGLFGGETVSNVVICDASTGKCTDYAVEDVPKWVDKVYSAELLMQLYDYSGIYVRGFWNSILGQKDCLQTTNGYNYIAKDDDVWVYTGVTSVNSDQSNVGFVLMNQRTMETKFYVVEGAIEDSAMSSAEGQVQNLGYDATFPLLINVADEPTYFMALKDGAGLVKKYAMVNVEKYQWVAIGDTVREVEKNYRTLLSTNGIESDALQEEQKVTGRIEAISNVVLDGTTHV